MCEPKATKPLIALLTNEDVDVYCFRKELIEAFIDEGYRVLVSCPYGEKLELMKDIDFIYDDVYIDRRGTSISNDLKLYKHYRKLFKEHKPDVVLTYTVKPNIYAGFACRVLKIPYIENITGFGTAVENKGLLSKVVLTMYKIGAGGAKQIFYQNEENQRFSNRKVLKKIPGKLIPGSGINTDFHAFHEYLEDDGTIRFLFVGRIMKNKGIEEYLKCAEYITEKYDNVQFDIVGDYEEEEYRDRINNLQKEGVVNHYGKQMDVRPFYENHHALIHPSYHEGMSNVLLENAACGRPCIATNVPGCKEIYDDGITGLGFEARSAEALIEAVEKFLSKPYDEYKQMGKKARIKVETEFSRDIVVKAYKDEIKQCQWEQWTK